jgi:hypothetical protein
MDGSVGSSPACYGSSNPDISQKYKMGDMSIGVPSTLARQKNIQKALGANRYPEKDPGPLNCEREETEIKLLLLVIRFLEFYILKVQDGVCWEQPSYIMENRPQLSLQQCCGSESGSVDPYVFGPPGYGS